VETITDSPTYEPEHTMFDEELHAVYRLLNSELVVAQDRCVDALLDLYNAAPSTLIQELIGEMLSDIRFVSAVRSQLLRDDLTLVTAAVRAA